jgi:ABC-type dipeptide/oligopeptide/nickel transport system ATPase component
MTSLNPVTTIGAQIEDVLRRHAGLHRSAARERAIELLDQVGIPFPARRIDDYAHQFSGGMRQRALIAIAISCDPDLLIADEPTTALDVTVQAQILRLLLRLREERAMSLMLITHDFGVVAGMVERVNVMYGGRIVETAGVDDIFRSPAHEYTRALLGAVPRLHRDGVSP